MSEDSSETKLLKKVKVVVLGEQNVGKTALVTKLAFDRFESDYQPTSGIDLYLKSFEFHDQQTVQLHIWDTTAVAAVAVYDVTNRSSFEQALKYIDDVRKKQGNNLQVVMLLGNKADLEEDRQVSEEEASLKAQQMGLLFMETSAKTGDNVRETFHKLAENLANTEPLQI